MKFNYINTGKVVRFSGLIQSGDITDRNIIEICDTIGEFVTRGNWYQDNVLAWGSFTGVASKAGTGLTVKFQLV